MIAVSLLGRVSVSVDGAPISGEAAQRRRVALLALLCTPPARPISRDRLMLYLWPDSDVESARHLLSVAVHVLRKTLGHEVVVTTADEVSLAPGAVDVDVAAFEEAVARGDHEAAVALYGGAFMDGFHAGAGVELEQWIDGERTRLQRAFAQALEGLAQKRRAAFDAAGAVEAWRSLATLDPYSSHGALGLMRALAEAGNRAGAIRHAAVHRQLLEGELGAGPDPEVEALAEALRAEPPAILPLPAPAASVADGRAAPAAASAAAEGHAVPAPEPRVGGAADTRQEAGREPLPRTVSPLAVAVLAPEGPHDVPAPGQPLPRRWRRGRWAVAAAVVVLVGLTGYLVLQRNREKVAPSVAVLPCNTIPAVADSQWWGDGIAGDVLDELSTVKGLRVIARTSSFASAYRGPGVDVHKVGDELGAEFVVSCTVQPTGSVIRVSMELSRAEDRSRIWSQRFDKPYGDVLVIEDDVGKAVTRELGRKMLPDRRGAWGTTDVDAHAFFLRARHAWDERTPESLLSAIHYFEQAIARDSNYAEAYTGLAETLIVAGGYDYGLLEPDNAFPSAKAHAQRALELDWRLPGAHAALAAVYLNYEWNVPAAEKEFRQAIELEPDYSSARQWYALLLTSQGRNAEAQAQLDSARASDPKSPLLFVQRGHYFYYTHHYELALAELQKALQIERGYATAHLLGALTEIQLGHAAQVAARMQKLSEQAQNPVVMAVLGYARGRAGDRAGAVVCRDWLVRTALRTYVPAELIALVDVGMGDKAAALDRLDDAYKRKSNGMVYLAVEPALDPLRSEPRFAELVKATPAATYQPAVSAR